MTSLAATEAGCLVPDCDGPHHGRGFCVVHYQQWRRSPTGEPPLPVVKAARHRDWLIRRELSLGFLPEGMESPFASEDDRRAAWDRYGPELTAEHEAYERGLRPSAWWRYVAGRPEHLGRCPSMHEADLTERTRWAHLAEVEKWTWLAADGHLTPEERNRIAERGREGRTRI